MNGRATSLPPRVLALLEYLLQHPEEVVGKQELIDAVWPDTVVAETSLSEAIKILRQELGDDPHRPTYIQTVHRRGYRFIAPISTVQPETAVDSAVPQLASQISGVIAQVVAIARHHQLPIAWTLVVLLAAVAAVTTALWRQSSNDRIAQSTVHLTMSLPSDLPYSDWPNISRDGTRVAYRSGGLRPQLVIRTLDQREFSPIPGVPGRRFAFSPDGNWVAFAKGTQLKKVALDGSTPVSLGIFVTFEASVQAWGARGIVYGDSSGLHIVSAEGGSPRRLTTIDTSKGGDHRRASILPDGKTVLFSVFRPETGVVLGAAVVSLETGEQKTVLESAYGARYVPTGHLVYWKSYHNLALWARPFDLSSLEAYGQEVRLIDEVWDYDVSDMGTFIYYEPLVKSLGVISGLGVAVAVSHDGVSRSLPLPSGLHCAGPRLSPNGRELAIACEHGDSRERQIWIGYMERGTFSERPFSGINVAPVWSPNGRSIAHSSHDGDRWRIVIRPSDGSGTARQLLEAEYPIYPQSWSADGEVLAYQENHPETGENIRLLPLQEGGLPLDLAVSAAHESGAMFSPDGKWIVYHSNESGEFHTYVQPYPGPGERTQISTVIGGWPMWSRDGRAIYYMTSGVWAMMVVDVSYDSGFSPGKPRRLFETRGRFNVHIAPRSHLFDITPDGQEFVMSEGAVPQGTELQVVLNWFDELNRLVPTDP